ncbi:MAG: ester cyclase, partial [Anaerolineae bacterium]|nr:ester cyclase [Anaerolineae bacterium]
VLRAAFPDFQLTIEEQVSEGDRVATRWNIQGTHQGEFQGIAATGRPVKVTGMTIFRIAAGKVTDGWTNEDELGLMRQIGAVPMGEK